MSDFLDKELEKIDAGLAQTEAIKKEADHLMINKIKKYEDEISRLKEDRDRLVEENSNYETISKSHKEINGELRKELNEVKEDNKKMAKLVDDYLDKLRKAGFI